MEFFSQTFPAIITSIATIIAAYIVARPRNKNRRENGTSRIYDPFMRIVLVIAAGSSITAVVFLYISAFGNIQTSNQLGYLSKKGTIAGFVESTAGIGSELEDLDKDANAILNGSGPRIWTKNGSINEETWSIGQTLYVKESDWIDEVFPNKDKERENSTDSISCLLEPKGKLTVKGFSKKRYSALLEYQAPGDSRGTPCDTPTYFFYPLPK